MDQKTGEQRPRRRLVIPLVLTVSTMAGLAALASTATGCDDEDPMPIDGGVGDGQPDTPPI